MMDIPIATYRLQLNAQFNFKHIEKIISYLKKLGISHVYLSPITKSQPKSSHGYDVTDFRVINKELGGQVHFESLVKKLKNHNLKILLDYVPNHMAATPFNKMWKDVTKRKKKSRFAFLFDIDWNLSKKQLFYRRFFDINELVCLNQENLAVFATTHHLLLSLIKKIGLMEFELIILMELDSHKNILII